MGGLPIQKAADGTWVIKNPVCPDENFADKWHLDNNKRAKSFFRWLDWLVEDIQTISVSPQEKIKVALEGSFGTRVAAAVIPSSASSLLIHSPQGEIVIETPPKPWKS